MNLERKGVSTSALGSLKNCLVEGDPEQERRTNQGKRRAVLVSIVVQLLILTALVIFPLFSKGEHITFERTPLPPYPRLGSHEHRGGEGPKNPPPPCHFCAPTSPTRPIITQDTTRSRTGSTGDEPHVENLGDPRGLVDGNTFVAANPGPDPVIEKRAKEAREKRRITVGHIEPALLIQRVEPIYPRLAITLRHETRVELHAIISTDGSIQSLEVLSGDPLFYQSSLDAVQQWRYCPTYLNGQPVEVDTRITVIYILNR